MNSVELDNIYTQLCNRMSELGEENTSLFLARFVLLAIARELDADTAYQLIEDAAFELARTASSSTVA